MKALGLVVSEKNMFFVFPVASLWELMTPGCGRFCVTDRSKSILLWWFFLFYVFVFKTFFVLLAPYVCYHIFS